MASPPCLSSKQFHSLSVLLDTFFPSLDDSEIASIISGHTWRSPPEIKDSKVAIDLLRKSASELELPTTLEILLSKEILSWEETFNFKLVLELLGSRVGSALISMSNPLQGSFVDLPRKERQHLLSKMSSSPVPLQRKAFNDIKRIVFSLGLSFVPETSENGEETARNPCWDAMGYNPILSQEEYKNKEPWNEVDYTDHMVSITKDSSLEVDVVIVGSGAGGGVCAATLSARGYKVLVLEKAEFIAPKENTTLEVDGFEKMYEKGGLLTSSDGSMAILAGSALGGGTSINWGCCIPTPSYVREEWSSEAGLTQFKPAPSSSFAPEGTFDHSLNSVWERISAKVVTDHNPANAALKTGCERLGIDSGDLANNLKNPSEPSAGWTCFGDRWGNKQTGVFTYLADAARTGNCQFIDRCEVEHLTFEKAPSGGGRDKASGVVAHVHSKASTKKDPQFVKLNVKAKHAVVLSCGSLHSPCVMLRSDIGRENQHVGKHLKLHPVTAAIGCFQGEDFSMYSRAPMTAISRDNEMGPMNNGFGARLEVPSVHPGLMGACLPWGDGVDAKASLIELKSSTAIIALQRDIGEGQVCLSTQGLRKWLPRANKMDPPLVHYSIDPRDEASMKHSLVTSLNVLIAAGASQVTSLHSPNYGIHASFPTEDDKVAKFADLKEKVNKIGLPQHGVGLFSAHQMGTCRMGSDPLESVVDCDGESWDKDNLYVMDASVFPSASGANPMVTTLAISHLLSNRLAKRLKADCNGSDEITMIRQERRDVALQKQRAAQRYAVVQSILAPLMVVVSATLAVKIVSK